MHAAGGPILNREPTRKDANGPRVARRFEGTGTVRVLSRGFAVILIGADAPRAWQGQRDPSSEPLTRPTFSHKGRRARVQFVDMCTVSTMCESRSPEIGEGRDDDWRLAQAEPIVKDARR